MLVLSLFSRHVCTGLVIYVLEWLLWHIYMPMLVVMIICFPLAYACSDFGSIWTVTFSCRQKQLIMSFMLLCLCQCYFDFMGGRYFATLLLSRKLV